MAGTIELRIERVVYGGDGLGRHEGRVIFVPVTAPGDLARVRIVEEKKGYSRAEAVSLLEAGPGRTEPPCPVFGRCAGCQWQHIDYALQVDVKRSILEEIFHHKLPGSRDVPVRMTPSPTPWEYRSRVRVRTQGKGGSRQVGFFAARSHRIVDIPGCPLLRPSLNRALSTLREQDPVTGRRYEEFDVACSEETGRWAIAPSAADDATGRAGGPATGGSTLLERRVAGFSYLVAASTFFQANDLLVDELAGKVAELAQTSSCDSALDLYSGVGLFTLPLARRYARVAAVESSPYSAHLCRRNAERAGLFNVQSFHSDVLQWLRRAGRDAKPAADLILVDPPRTGLGRAIAEEIVQWEPETIIYVSCDPQTLCRDAAFLDGPFHVDYVEGFDLFPHTFHFETVMRFRKR